MESIIVLGADRVGKTTAINSSRKILEAHSLSVTVCHFGGISPKHHGPMEQFVDVLTGIDTMVDFLLIDRFAPDTLFYEPYRYQMPPVPYYTAQEPESMLLEMSAEVKMVIVEYRWDGVIELRHTEEILKLYPGCTEYWLKQQVEKRRKEHKKYYEFIDKYVNKHTLIKSSNIYRLPGHLCLNSIDLEMAPGFKLC